MKYILGFLFIFILALLGVGFYVKATDFKNGEVIIGLAVLLIAFVLMPLFIFHRYKNKDLSSFKFEFPPKKEEEKEDKK